MTMRSGIELFLEAATGRELWLSAKPVRIAVFGGPLSPPGSVTSPLSLRDAFMRWMRVNAPELASLVLCPESYKDWNHFDKYNDLLSFEEDLGHVTSAVLIFLEAPGAIAELGAFCQTESLRDQLIVVVRSQYHPNDSFISLGPLRKLETIRRNSVCVLPDCAPEKLHEHIELVVRALRDKIPDEKTREEWRQYEKRHRIILVLDVITILHSAAVADISRALTHFGVQESDSRIRQVLYTLESAGFVIRKRRGGVFYFTPVHADKAWIQYAGTAAKPFNRARVRARIARLQERYRRNSPTEAASLAHEIVRLAA